MSKYEIKNTTIKPVRKDKNGKDLRTAIERVGHPVQFRDDRDRTTVLPAGAHAIVNELDGGLLGLQRAGFISINHIEDISTALRAHTLQGNDARSVYREKKAATKDGAKAVKKASASQMGKENYEQTGGAEHDEAVNPDGDPNFLAKASTSTSGNRRKRAENAAKSGRDQENGQG